MKRLCILFLCCLGLLAPMYAQWGLVEKVLNSHQNKTIKKETKENLRPVYIFDDTLLTLRMPEKKIKSPAKKFIIILQDLLDESFNNYVNAEKIENISQAHHFLVMIRNLDSRFSTDYYENELKKYDSYNQNRLMVQTANKRMQDSIAGSERLASKIKRDSIQKVKTDSLLNARSEFSKNNPIRYMPGGRHGHLTVFTGDFDFNFSHQRLIGFLEEYMGMTEKSQDYENGYITSIVKKKVSKGNPPTFTIKYKVNSNKNDGLFYIENVSITGDRRELLHFYVYYWETSLQFEDLRANEWVYNYYAPDRIGVQLISSGRIKITIDRM